MSQRNIFSAIDIRSDKIICLIAQELEIINRGKILQLIGIGISKLPINCIKPLSLPHVEISDYIKSAITKAEYEANVKISDVFEKNKFTFFTHTSKVKSKICDSSLNYIRICTKGLVKMTHLIFFYIYGNNDGNRHMCARTKFVMLNTERQYLK